jgi:L-iditol 2-dehydrogenase
VRAAVYHSNEDVRLVEMERPEAGPGELLVRIEASGICGSDVMEWYRLRKAPLVLGHEIAGVVEEAGEGVTSFRPGDRVTATHHVPCNTCRYCLAGQPNVCDTLRTTSFDPGGFAEYVRLPAINVDRGTLRLPDSVSFEEASFVEPLACVVRALRIAGLTPGHSVAVLGSGIAGMLMILTARALGAGAIFATDVSDYRLAFARSHGADHVAHAEGNIPELLRDTNGGRPADLVLVCTAARSAIDQAFHCIDRGGTILFFAPLEPGTTFPVPMFDIWKDGIRIVHSYAGPPADMRTALGLIVSRRVDVASTITHRLPLADTAQGFRMVAEAGESMKVIIEPQR